MTLKARSLRHTDARSEFWCCVTLYGKVDCREMCPWHNLRRRGKLRRKPQVSRQVLGSSPALFIFSCNMTLRSQAFCLTVHPRVHGGGAKAANEAWTRNRIAAICLSQGVDVQATTEFADKLAEVVGAAALYTVVKGTNTQGWEGLQQMAGQAGLLPDPAEAEHRIRKAVASASWKRLRRRT